MRRGSVTGGQRRVRRRRERGWCRGAVRSRPTHHQHVQEGHAHEHPSPQLWPVIGHHPHEQPPRRAPLSHHLAGRAPPLRHQVLCAGNVVGEALLLVQQLARVVPRPALLPAAPNVRNGKHHAPVRQGQRGHGKKGVLRQAVGPVRVEQQRGRGGNGRRCCAASASTSCRRARVGAGAVEQGDWHALPVRRGRLQAHSGIGGKVHTRHCLLLEHGKVCPGWRLRARGGAGSAPARGPRGGAPSGRAPLAHHGGHGGARVHEAERLCGPL